MNIRVLALLQNQWFNNPSRMRKLLTQYQKHEGGYWHGRARFCRDMLFMGCKTGRMINKAFGDCWCDYGGLVFEEVSTRMGDKPGTCFPPNPKHILGLLRVHDPEVVIAFGRVAVDALDIPEVAEALHHIYKIKTVHPAARGDLTLRHLKDAATDLNTLSERKQIYYRNSAIFGGVPDTIGYNLDDIPF